MDRSLDHSRLVEEESSLEIDFDPIGSLDETERQNCCFLPVKLQFRVAPSCRSTIVLQGFVMRMDAALPARRAIVATFNLCFDRPKLFNHLEPK